MISKQLAFYLSCKYAVVMESAAKGGAAANCIILLGPTATGKTSLAVKLADHYNGQIISADSRQVYKGLDLGSGKDLEEYIVTDGNGGKKQIPYHLIDIADLSQEYSVFNYQKDFYRDFASIAEKNILPVICGGTGMYLDSIIRGYELQEVPTNTELRLSLNGLSMEELAEKLRSLKPDLHNSTDLTERHRLLRAIEIAEYEKTPEAQKQKAQAPARPNIVPYILGLTFPRDVLRKRIKDRLRLRFKLGMIEEVDALHKNGVPWERLERLGLEYGYISRMLQGKIKSEELFSQLYIAIGQFAKRQETWFRGMERKGVHINWIPTTAQSTTDQVFASALDMLCKAGICV